jgi:nucleoside-diphosphate-sugar epimerase
MTTSHPEPRAFVAGATGYVGLSLVPLLAQRGVQTRAHVRPDSPRGEEHVARFKSAGAEVSRAAWEPAALLADLESAAPTHIFCLVGTTWARARREGASYESVDLALTEMLIDASMQLAGPPRFVYVSSIGTSARRATPYHRVRWQCEEAVRKSGLPYTIARPSLITGPGREESRSHERLLAALVGPPLAALRFVSGGTMGVRYQPTSGPELARGLIHAAFNYTTIGRVVEGSELRDVSTNDQAFDEPISRRDASRW